MPDAPSSNLADFAAAVFISVYLNSCFLVAETIMITHGPQGKLRVMIDAMAHVLSGPIAFIAFFNGGFLGTFLFFCSIWHFLCDTGNARPSYVFLSPCRNGASCEKRFVWFTSFWLLVHHTFIGVFKLSIDMGIVDPNAPGCESCTPPHHLIRSWMAGATMSHLSMGMSHFGLRGAVQLRLLSLVLRVGVGEVGLILTQRGTLLQLAMMWDLFWMTIMIALVMRPRCADSSDADDDASVADGLPFTKELPATAPLELAIEDGADDPNASLAIQMRRTIIQRQSARESRLFQPPAIDEGKMSTLPPGGLSTSQKLGPEARAGEMVVPVEPQRRRRQGPGGWGAAVHRLLHDQRGGSGLDRELVLVTHQAEWLHGSHPANTWEARSRPGRQRAGSVARSSHLQA